MEQFQVALACSFLALLVVGMYGLANGWFVSPVVIDPTDLPASIPPTVQEKDRVEKENARLTNEIQKSSDTCFKLRNKLMEAHARERELQEALSTAEGHAKSFERHVNELLCELQRRFGVSVMEEELKMTREDFRRVLEAYQHLYSILPASSHARVDDDGSFLLR
jgi:predicted  nucleic acid-binding Zn-ribbon protein